MTFFVVFVVVFVVVVVALIVVVFVMVIVLLLLLLSLLLLLHEVKVHVSDGNFIGSNFRHYVLFDCHFSKGPRNLANP